MMKLLPPSLRRISLNKLEGVEKLATFIMLKRFSEWGAAPPQDRFDYSNRVRRDLFFLLGAEESIITLLLGPVGTVFEECVTACIRNEDSPEVVAWSDEGAVDVRSTLWSVFIRLGFGAQKEFARAIGIDPAVVTRVFKALNTLPADSGSKPNSNAGITIDRLNAALTKAGVFPRFDQITLRQILGNEQRPDATQQPDATQVDGALTVREWHLIKLSGYLGRLAERSSPHSSYQFIEHFTSLVQCAAESLCWLTASSEPRTPRVTTAVLDTAFELVCHALGSIPDLPEERAAPNPTSARTAAVFGTGPVFCPTSGGDTDATQRTWQKILAMETEKSHLDTEGKGQLYSEFAREWCIRRISSSIASRAAEFSDDATGTFGEIALEQGVLDVLRSLQKPSPKLFQQLDTFWERNLEEHTKRRDSPQLRESLFWRFIWEVTTAIQTCSYGEDFAQWRQGVGKKSLELLKLLNLKMTELAANLDADSTDVQQQAAWVADFNEQDCRFHLALADCFRTQESNRQTTPVQPSQDTSLLRRLFAITTLLRSTRRHANSDGRSSIIKEHEEIIRSVEQLLEDTSATTINSAKDVYYPAPDVLQNYVNSLYRHLFSAPDNETANSSDPFIPSLARLIYSLPCIEKYADLQRQWEQCDLMVLLTLGTVPLEFSLAGTARAEDNLLKRQDLLEVFSTIALSCLESQLSSTPDQASSTARKSVNPKMVVLAGDRQSFQNGKNLLRNNSPLPFEEWDVFYEALKSGVDDLKYVLRRVCARAFELGSAEPTPRSSWSELVRLISNHFHNITLPSFSDRINQAIDDFVSLETVVIPEFAVGAGELKAVSWRQDDTASFTSRKRKSEFIYYAADHESDDRNGLVINAVLRSLNTLNARSNSTWSSIERRCRTWLGRPSEQSDQWTRGTANPATGATPSANSDHVDHKRTLSSVPNARNPLKTS